MVKSTRRIASICTAICIAMFAFSFLLVPLYNVLCRATGLNGKMDLIAATPLANSLQTIPTRVLTIEFVTTNNQNLPWEFFPQKNHLQVFTGKTIKTFFYAKNNTQKLMTVQAIPSIAPGEASKYFHKTECFCFQRQTLAAGAEKNMPLIFYIDPNLPADIHTITLSYTLFDMTEKRKNS